MDRLDTPRTACIDDLKNYFKKSDLFAGLTELEQQEARKNLGIVDGANQSKLIEITYAELYSMILNNLLTIGAVYKITDFQTMYLINNIVQSSDIIPLIVIAITPNTLFQIAYIENKNWIIHYSPTKTDVHQKGTITWMQDENGNSAFYDFKNIKFQKDSILYYTFSELQNGIIVDSSTFGNTKYNILSQECTENVFLGDTYNNILLPGCQNNFFKKGCINSKIGYYSVNNIFEEAVRYTAGTLANKNFKVNDTTLSTTITKKIHKVNDADIVSFLDPITYAYQIVKI